MTVRTAARDAAMTVLARAGAEAAATAEDRDAGRDARVAQHHVIAALGFEWQFDAERP